MLLLGFNVLIAKYPAERVAFPITTAGNSSRKAFGGLNPHWTTEQLEPRFAYVQYATDFDYLCNAIMNFARLDRFATQFDQVLIYPKDWEEPGTSREHNALINIRKLYPHINLRAVDVLSTSSGDPTWHKSLTKFHAFALTEYTRVLIFDSDSMVLNNMDHYFLAPLAPVAVPRAYWLNDKNSNVKDQMLGSHVMLIEPNEANYQLIINEATSSGAFDMEVLNHLFWDSAMILPHRRIALLTGEFRNKDHDRYMSENKHEEWNAMAEVSRAYLVHFSDWPLPKPWLQHSDAQMKAVQPECDENEVEKSDRPRCADRVMWLGFYEDYYHDQKEVCAPLTNSL
ncbi:Glycosyl transferase family 8 [Penicillium brevicompactum]|uniref:Glycosyl transferase family 8 n=1 Tax=Penicillium brevicompactum TaxID=5074 RepID=UPI0025419C00|nr:Glycosyl transferase family 8 [Penicillium brevicompactum]KAJ5334305.1 Glycosyl transferase family 8 [Penicillium brevicompactum]